MKSAAFALLLSTGAAFGVCPAATDHTGPLGVLIERANSADSETQGRSISQEMWDLWLSAPDIAAQEVLDRGLARRSSYDFAGAFADFERLIEYCPNYAEGYNQRAYISFLRQDYAGALRDLDRALALSPRHIPAQSGRALTLMNLGRLDEARMQLIAALELNPWIPERLLIEPGAPLGVQGEDI